MGSLVLLSLPLFMSCIPFLLPASPHSNCQEDVNPLLFIPGPLAPLPWRS